MECKKYFFLSVCFGLLFFLLNPIGVQALATDPLSVLPTGSQKPEELGWYKVGQSTGGFHCFDLSHLPSQDSAMPDNILPPEEVRYVMFLNNSALTSTYSSLEGGADPDGVVALNTRNPGNSGYVVWNQYPNPLDSLEIHASVFANAVTWLKMGVGLANPSWGCDQTSGASHLCGSDRNFSDNPLGVISTTSAFLRYMNCGACALGNDPNPAWWGAEGGYIILDMACSSVSGTSCSSQSAEDSGRVIVDGPGDDFCISETGYNESFRVYALPYEAPPDEEIPDEECDPCDCTPTCPSGQSRTVTGPYCAVGGSSCGCTDSCGVSKVVTGSTCYLPETNVAPDAPEYMYYCEDGTSNCTQLSTDSSNPTRILLPGSEQTVQIATESVAIPDGSNSRGIQYYINVDNQVNPWIGGACGSDVNEYDYCSGWQDNPYTIDLRDDIGMQEGSRYGVFAYSASQNRCDDGVKSSGRAVGYFVIDYNPEFDSFDPDDSGNMAWIGTEVDEDVTYGVDCSATPDNNPYTFKVQATDLDGSSDIESLQVNLAKSDQLTSGTYDAINWPMRLWFKANRETSESAYFAVRDAAVSESPSVWTDQHCCSGDSCNVGISGNCQPNSGNCYCWKVDDHNWDSAQYVQGQNYNGNTVDVYYLSHDMTVYSDGYELRLIGDSNWRNATKVMYETGGDAKQVWGEFKVAFDGDENDLDWEGSYRNVWYVADVLGAEDEDLDSGEELYQWCSASDLGNSSACTDFIIEGTTKIDLTPPSIIGQDITYGDGDSDCGALNYDELCYRQRVTDSRFSPGNRVDLGISQILGMSYKVNDNDSVVFADPYIKPWVQGITYEWSSEYTKVSNLQGDDVVKFNINATVDNVCNISQQVDDSITVGSPWIATLDGDVYSALGYSINIAGNYPKDSENNSLSDHWIGGRVDGSGRWSISGGISSLLDWNSDNYDDENRLNSRASKNWYDELNRVAGISDCNKLSDCSVDTENNIGDVLSADRGIYHLSGDVNIAQGQTCTNAKLIFIDGDLTVQPQFSVANENSGCLFVVNGDVTLGQGSNRGGNMTEPDRIESAFVVNGKLTTPDDPVPPKVDRLIVKGFIFADNGAGEVSTSFERDLVFEDNVEYPAEAVEYDPRYLYLLRDMLGSKSYWQFECGIVHDSDACEDWVMIY